MHHRRKGMRQTWWRVGLMWRRGFLSWGACQMLPYRFSFCAYMLAKVNDQTYSFSSHSKLFLLVCCSPFTFLALRESFISNPSIKWQYFLEWFYSNWPSLCACLFNYLQAFCLLIWNADHIHSLYHYHVFFCLACFRPLFLPHHRYNRCNVKQIKHLWEDL